ncbi:MAG: 4Fe-4S binding protein [Acutalibacteraceae bacterium]
MESQKQNRRKNKHISVIQIIRVVIQIAAFIAAPGLFITVFSSIGEIFRSLINGQFSFAEYSGRIILLAAVFIVTFIWGRFFCRFICSFGAMQDLLWAGGKHIKHKPKISEKADKGMKFIKFGVLLFVIIAVWTFSLTDGILWSPWTIFGMYATLKGFPSAEYLLSLGGLLLLLIMTGSVFIERFFCKYLCPLGALFDLVSHFRIFKIKKPTEKCGSCRMCTKQCSMSIPLYKYESVKSGECINCMKCTESCPRQNTKADTIPAVSGTIAAAALVGVYYAGTIPALNGSVDTVQDNVSEISDTDSTGKYKNGTYSGTGSGFRGNIDVTVTVSGGKITDITVNSYNDDKEFFEKAKNKIISEIISEQDTAVSTVSGATFSSNGIIEAVSNALEIEFVNPNGTISNNRHGRH